MGRLAELIDESRATVSTIVSRHRQQVSMASLSYRIVDTLEEMEVEVDPGFSVDEQLTALADEAKRRHHERAWLRKEYARLKEAEEAAEQKANDAVDAEKRVAAYREAELRAALDVQQVESEARLRCMKAEAVAMDAELAELRVVLQTARDAEESTESKRRREAEADAVAGRQQGERWRAEALKLAAQIESANARLGEAMRSSKEAQATASAAIADANDRAATARGDPSISTNSSNSSGGSGSSTSQPTSSTHSLAGATACGYADTRRDVRRRPPSKAKSLSATVDIVVDRLGALGGIISELNCARQAMEVLRHDILHGARDEAASERRALITSALASMAQLRRQ